MFKIYHIFILKRFLIKFFFITSIFFSLTIILGLLEEISFFKDSDVNFLYPYFLTLLSAPITLFEIFPFIILLSVQFLYYELFTNDELNLLKKNGLQNTKIIKLLIITSISIGLFNILIYYNAASILKFKYLEIKNIFSKDNRYLAMVTDSGLWIKDEIDEKKLIIKAKYINKNLLNEVIINEFDKNFELINTIQSKKIDIKKNTWIIYNPILSNNNISKKLDNQIFYTTNFNEEKINNLFSNISASSLFRLFELKEDFKKLGYSSDEIEIQILKIFSLPLFYAIIVSFSSIIMLSFSQNKPLINQIVLGIIISILIYYMNFIFNSLGINGKIPLLTSVYFPFLVIATVTLIGLVNIDEK